MFFIYHGYVNADNYDASEGPIYSIHQCSTEAEVVAFKKEFEDGIYDECLNVIFRVFEGKERELKPKEVVTTYELG